MHLMHLKSLLCPMRFTLDCKHLESRDDITNILIWPSACSPVNAYIHCCCVTSVVSNSMWPQRRQPTRLRRPWDSPGKNTGVGCHLLLQCIKVKSESEVAQLCPTRSDPRDCSPPGSSVHGIFQARVLLGSNSFQFITGELMLLFIIPLPNLE